MSSIMSDPKSRSILPGWSKLGSARDRPGRFRTPLRWNPGKSPVILGMITAYNVMGKYPFGDRESSALKRQSGTSVSEIPVSRVGSRIFLTFRDCAKRDVMKDM